MNLNISTTCVVVGFWFKVQAKLVCFYFTVFYVAAFVNEYRPESTCAACIFGLPLAISVDSKKQLALAFVLTNARFAAFLMSCFLGLYLVQVVEEEGSLFGGE
uniref:Uncharacterized protein n=1 Tax=Nelumbo nucifera TaxID=4432 RepID=A0A822XXA3_NELNU|nr:TPA_asm: hypothetical protein HUJ06_025264 [Nelumbo nucifera]